MAEETCNLHAWSLSSEACKLSCTCSVQLAPAAQSVCAGMSGEQFCKKSKWSKIPPECCEGLIESLLPNEV